MADEEQIARVARALCVADGQSPDAEITIGTHDVETDAGGIGYRRTVKGPAWTSYVGEARRFIAAARALGLVELTLDCRNVSIGERRWANAHISPGHDARACGAVPQAVMPAPGDRSAPHRPCRLRRGVAGGRWRAAVRDRRPVT